MGPLRTLTLVAALMVSAAAAFAHDAGMQNMHMPGMNMAGMMGMHDMVATVSVVDSYTGIVDVDAGGMKLKVHFPSSALANIKAGDKITLHLAFTRP